MQNCLIAYPNRIDASVVSGGNWRGQLPITNLQKRTLTKVARTVDTSVASARIDIDTLVGRQTRVIAAVNHNLSLAAKYRLRGSSELEATNYVLNNSLTGLKTTAEYGTIASLPTFWLRQHLNTQGVFLEISNPGAEDGFECFDCRIYGSSAPAGNSTNFRIVTQNFAAGSLLPGQDWTGSIFLKMVAGSLPDPARQYVMGSVRAFNSGVQITYDDTENWTLPPVTTSFKECRQVVSVVTPTGITSQTFNIVFPLVTGQPFDFTVRIGLPQFERGRRVTSVIRTYGTPVTRPAGYMDDMQSYDYDTGWRDVWPEVYPYETLEWESDSWWSGKYSAEDLAGYTPNLTVVLPKPLLHRTWRLEFDDANNPDGYIQVGRVFLGPAWQPEKNPSFGLTQTYETQTEVQRTRGGAEYFSYRKPYRVTRFSFDNLPESDGLASALELDRRAGIDKEVYWVQNPEDTVHAIRRQFLGRFRSLNGLEYPAFGITKKAYEIKELL